MFGPKKIKQEKIVEQWSTLIEGANGSGQKVIDNILNELKRLETPNLHASIQERAPDGGFMREKRSFLVAEHKKFDTHDMYVSIRNYGKQLLVAWYLTEEPITFMRLFMRNPLRAILMIPYLIAQLFFGYKFQSVLNLFDTEEMTAHVTTVHHAVLNGIKEMMEEQNMDFTKIDGRTRGFLNIT